MATIYSIVLDGFMQSLHGKLYFEMVFLFNENSDIICFFYEVSTALSTRLLMKCE